MTIQNKDLRAERLRQAIRLKKAAARSRGPDFPPRPADQEAYLGEMQRSLWLVHQMDPRSPAYNLASAFRLEGPLDVARLERAFGHVVARHRLLRSTFRADRDDVLQIVHPPDPLAVEVLEEEDGGALGACVREAKKPFDLENGPLVRMRLVEERSTEERFLLLVLHHILADERSLFFLWEELAELYGGLTPEREARIQYDDFVHWQRQNRGDPRPELAYWRRRLDPLPEDLRLPFEDPAAGAGEPCGRLLERPLDVEVRRGVHRLAAAAGVTPFTAFAFAFQLLLHRYTAARNVAFATPVSTRSHPATAKMIGYFLNPVVVRIPVEEERSVKLALQDFNRELRDVLAHASVPFQALTEELSPPRQRERHPIFQAMFVYQERRPPPSFGGARLEPVSLDLGESKFDLTLFVAEGESSLKIAVEYRADRSDRVFLENLLRHYETLLEHLPEDPERPAADVPMSGAEERDWLRAVSQGAALDLAGEALLPRQILDRTQRTPQLPAVIGGGVRLSYGELERSACSIARELISRGIRPGGRVGLFLDRSPRMIAGLVGSLWAGAAYVPLDPAYPEARNRSVLEDASVAAILTTSALRNRLPEGPWEVIAVDEVETNRESGAPDGSFPTAALTDLAPESPAYLLYTSGSSGHPKGVIVTHGNLRASNGARRKAYDVSPRRFLLVPSLAFDSSVVGIFWTLVEGGTLVLATDDEARDPWKLVRLVAAERVSGLLCVPSLYAQMLRVGGDRMRELEFAIVAGESCPSRIVEEHFRALPQVRLFNEYGPTEATVWATVQEMTVRDAVRPVAVGRPIPGVRVDVLDALGRAVPAGIPGHAWIAGPTVAHGYWRRPDLTEERFVLASGSGVAERRYRTGDRMAWTPDGRLLFLGREDEQIKLRGFRIEPGEVEAALLASPEVEEAAVVARELHSSLATASTSETTHLVAFVRRTDRGTDAAWDRDAWDRDAWRHDLAQRLPGHMIPSRLVALPRLPRLPNGKIDRQALRKRVLDPEARGGEIRTAVEGRIPSTREQGLISLWEGLLGRSGIDLQDNFFELGGHSLLVTQMIHALERDFGTSLRATDVFEHPTVHQLAQRIEQRGKAGAPAYQHLFPIQPSGRERPFIVAVPHFFSETFAARFRGERPVYGLRGVSLRPEGNRGRWRTMKDLGEELVEEIRRRFPGEPPILAGYSFGALMAVEAVRLMEERGIPVDRLYLIAPMPVDHYRFGPFLAQLDGLRTSLEELTPLEALRLYARGHHPLTRKPYARAWHWLAVKSWRRLLCLAGRLRALAGLPLTPRILHADVRLERFRLHARYRPGLVFTPTVIFNAQEAETDAAATWRPYFQGPFTVHETPDPHLGTASVEAAKQVILHHLSDLGPC